MSLERVATISPLPSPLPALVTDEPLTPGQWTTLFAIMDTFCPSLEVSSDLSSLDKRAVTAAEFTSAVETIQAGAPEGVDTALIHAYLTERPSTTPAARALIHRIVEETLRSDNAAKIKMVLTALGTRPGSLLLTGSTTPFHLQPLIRREYVIQGWYGSYLPGLAVGAKLLGVLSRSVWLKSSPTFPKVIGFPRAPVHGQVGEGYPYEFIQIPPGDGPETIETDVLIIGSGCGAGVTAKNLAESGNRVIVAEQRYHFAPKHLPMTETDGGFHLFQNGGQEVSDDSSIVVIAGSAFGGGGTINWSASLQTQGYVRKEWADGGLPFFQSQEFQNCLDRVCTRMGAATEPIEHNKTNRVLIEGGKKLGYNVKAVPQNSGGRTHYCGYCHLGCASNEKQGPVASWLPDAAKAGTLFMEGFWAEKIIFEKIGGKQVAVGATGIWKSRDVHGGVEGPSTTTRRVNIRAKRVIVSAGTLQSPIILLRSGLRNPNIGRHLHLHPCNFIGAVFPEQVNPWEGGILTVVVDDFANLDGAGHGPKLEALVMMPSIYLPIVPWVNGLDYKVTSSKFNRTTAFIALTRDRDTGRVYPDAYDGKSRVAYTPSAHDRKHALRGVLELAKMAFVCGATEIYGATAGVAPFVRKTPFNPDDEVGILDPDFQAWLAKIEKKGLPSPDTTFGSAHQMGTCRMGASPKNSVVDPDGKVWGTEGLYVADASVFPSASGVNPMVTNLALSDHISRGIAKELSLSGASVRPRL